MEIEKEPRECFSFRKLRKEREELFSRFFEVDDKQKLIKIRFEYDSLSDVFALDTGLKDKEKFLNKEADDRIESVVKHAPKKYDAALEYVIKDFSGYDVETCEKMFADALRIRSLSGKLKVCGMAFLALIPFVIGALFLLFNGLAVGLGWYPSEGFVYSVIIEIIDLAGSVFIWESVTLYFIERPETLVFQYSFRKCLVRIDFLKEVFEDEEGADFPFRYLRGQRFIEILRLFFFRPSGCFNHRLFDA